MTNLRRLGTAALLICVLGLTAWAECPNPGLMGTPPCLEGAQLAADNQATPTQTGAPAVNSPSPEAVDSVSLTELALNVLTLF